MKDCSKNDQRKVSKKIICFSMKKIVGSTLKLSASTKVNLGFSYDYIQSN